MDITTEYSWLFDKLLRHRTGIHKFYFPHVVSWVWKTDLLEEKKKMWNRS